VAATFDEFDAMLVELARAIRRYGLRTDEGVAADWALRVALVARYTGARRTAILQLRWEDLDLDRAKLTLPSEITKGGYGGRVVPLHPALAAEVETWERLGSSVAAAPSLELTGRGHVDRTVRRAWARAGVRGAVWQGQPLHVARKTIRSSMAASGVQPDVIDCYLGHAGVGTGGRSYTDRTWLWAPMVKAVAEIPPHPSVCPSMASRIACARARADR
jgi:integrase